MIPLRCIVASLALVCGFSSLTACSFGASDPPGCRTDHPEDCDDGWTCRAGACVHPTTTLSSPEAGASTDAAEDASQDAAQDAAEDASQDGAEAATLDAGESDAQGVGEAGAD
ncbi:MAG TPA: hypothetical protein PLI95_06925 [Polyangiaceae bacterium]|nr:hypothetical protein [Polyangiaceae bacterium]